MSPAILVIACSRSGGGGGCRGAGWVAMSLFLLLNLGQQASSKCSYVVLIRSASYVKLPRRRNLDNFYNGSKNHHEAHVILDTLAKHVGISVIENEQKMDSPQALLQLQTSASEEELPFTVNSPAT